MFVQLERAPKIVARRLATLPGIARLETRVVHGVTLDLGTANGRRAPATGRLVSLPAGATREDGGGLNRLTILRGRLPEPARPAEVVVGAGFAAAHGLGPGDQLHAVLNGRRTRLDIVGVGTSPEYIYTIGPGGPFPDDRSFGLFWMGRHGLAAAFDMTDAFNDVVAILQAGASVRDVCRGLDRELNRYGGRSGFGRAFQASHRYLTNELRKLRNMGRAGPVVFLAVTAILMHMVLSRLVGTQRERIATRAAFGLAPRAIGVHSMKLALVVLVCGAVVGLPLGWWLGVNLTAMYARFFRFPVLAFRPDPWAIGWSLAAAAAAALAGVAQSVIRATRISPADGEAAYVVEGQRARLVPVTIGHRGDRDAECGPDSPPATG